MSDTCNSTNKTNINNNDTIKIYYVKVKKYIKSRTVITKHEVHEMELKIMMCISRNMHTHYKNERDKIEFNSTRL